MDEDKARPMTFSVYHRHVAMLEAAGRYFQRSRSQMFQVILEQWWRQQDTRLIGMLSADSESGLLSTDSGNGLNGFQEG